MKRSKFYNFMVAVDQVGNTLAGGGSDNTISARVGAYAGTHDLYRARKYSRWYWLMMQKIIDTTFYPIDAHEHCHMAFHKELGKGFEKGSNFIKVILSFIIIVTCIPIAVVLYLLLLMQVIKPTPQVLSDIEIDGLEKVDEILKGAIFISEESETLPNEVLTKALETKENLDQLIELIKKRVN